MADKIIIGVHEMGDQVRYQTTQYIADQFCRYYKVKTAVPLGSFHSSDKKRDGIAKVPLNENDKLYFTEVYWADVPREPAKEGYTLEETKHWVKTIIERFRKNATGCLDNRTLSRIKKIGDKCTSIFKQDNDRLFFTDTKGKARHVKVDYRMIKSVLYEAIDAIDVMEKLLKVTKMAGLLEFNLSRILTDFMGDVQVVTEFEELRTKILTIFISTVLKAHQWKSDADIYIIAHSEGTVVAFLGLLEAMKQECPWIRNIKGFMTLGSPIDKHLILWPELWKDCEGVGNNLPENQIKWLNYYDLGDPVGYDLDTAREWKNKHARVFNFVKNYDCGFSRYYLPGKAHVDYWQDDDIFSHFIGSVVDTAQPKQDAKTPSPVPPPSKPQTKILAWIVSYIFPYLGAIALLFISVYLLYKPMHDVNEPASQLLKNVGGIAAIFAGLTVVTRIPRLTKRVSWLFIAGIIFVALASLSYYLLDDKVQKNIDSKFYGISYLKVAAVISGLVALIGKIYATARTKPLIFLGGIAVLWPAVEIAKGNEKVWPILLGGAIFLYGWWLSVLLFDLVFVWHRYICSSQALELLRDTRKKGASALSNNAGNGDFGSHKS